MASPMKTLISDGSRYLECYHHYLTRSTINQSMKNFVDSQLPEILERTVAGKSHLKVIGVGSGSGELDLQMFSMLHQKYPQVTVENEVVEPNPQQLCAYRDLVSQTPGLDYITFTWNQMTAEEFEEQLKEKKMKKRVDFIHMFQVLYYVKDRGATISFYQSLLGANGKLLLSLLAGETSVGKLWETYKNRIPHINYVSTGDIRKYLDSREVSYRSFKLPTQLDISDWLCEGGQEGDMLLEIVTQVLHFGKTVSAELKACIKEFLMRPDWTIESNGKVLLTIDFEVLVLDQLI